MDLVSRQMAERRERILEAAREIIGERGYEALTMRELARAARVTVPTIYNLIGSKDEVLLAAVEEQIARFLAGAEGAERAEGASDAPAAERALAVVESCVRELLRWPRYYRVLLLLLLSSTAAAAVRSEVDRILHTAFVDAVGGLAAAGELADWVEPSALADQLRLQLQATAMRWASGGLSHDRLRPAAVYGAAMVLGTATRGASRRAFETRAAEAQRRAAPRRRGAGAARKPRRSGGTGGSRGTAGSGGTGGSRGTAGS